MKKILLLITGTLCITCSLYAQHPQTINGIVQKVNSRKPLGGVTLFLRNSQTSAISNAQGSFTIKQSAYPDTLVVSHIGFKTKYIPIEGTIDRLFSIQLTSTTTKLRV